MKYSFSWRHLTEIDQLFAFNLTTCQQKPISWSIVERSILKIEFRLHRFRIIAVSLVTNVNRTPAESQSVNYEILKQEDESFMY